MNRRYRVPAGQLVPALMGGALFILVALGAAAQPWRQVGAGRVIIAVLAGGAGCVAVAMALTTHVTLTPAEISYRANLRRGAIPWPAVRSFRVGRARARGTWSCIVVEVGGRGDVRIPITGNRPYVERVLGEVAAYRAGLGRAT